MGILIDIILAVLAAFIIISYTVRGFVKSVLGAAKLFASAILSFVLTPMIFVGLDNTSLAVAYLLVFAAAYIVFSIVIFLVDKIFKLPLLNIVNRLLGLGLGIISAYITLTFVCSVFSLIISFSGGSLFGMTAAQIYDSTYIYRFFHDFSLLSIIK
ncbi:MAG: CvpA family protein [Ruminococcaceae bacterium]|nr:CvpA family protein [Oscillospiraceae bacterium]